MGAENMDKLDASSNSNRTQEKNNSPDMATVFQGFQSALTQLVAALKAQTEAFNSLKEDPLLQPDLGEEEITGTHGTSNLLDLNQFLDKSENDRSSRAASSTSVTRSDSEPTENLLGNLTQAFLATNKKSPDIEGDRKKILTREFSQDPVKARNILRLRTTNISPQPWWMKKSVTY